MFSPAFQFVVFIEVRILLTKEIFEHNKIIVHYSVWYQNAAVYSDPPENLHYLKFSQWLSYPSGTVYYNAL